MVFLDWEFIALCRRHRHRLRFGGAKMFPGAICFSGSGRMLLDLSLVPKMRCLRDFGSFDVDLV